MAETVVSNPRGAEISERTRELVLPDDEGSALRVVAAPERDRSRGVEREFGVSQSEISTTDPTVAGEATPRAATSGATRTDGASPEAASGSSQAAGASSQAANASTGARAASPDTSTPPPFPGDRTNRRADAGSSSNPGTSTASSRDASGQRPSFWRRIALGRRAHARAAEPSPAEPPPSAAAETERNEAGVAVATRNLAARAREAVAPAPPSNAVADTHALETRIVEPMLQALVSVEAKLERSHGDLMGRSDAVEQRLTQLWDIEEQLGTLGELQESLLQVSEQQRRLEAAVVGQTRTLRWLIGAVFFSLAAAAFVVAAIR